MTDAVNEQLITMNVASLVKLPSGKPPRPKVWTDPRVEVWRTSGVTPYPVMVWTAEQTAAFLERASRHRLFALFLLAAHCGLRRGEVCGLRWQDVDFKARSIEINQQIVQVGYHPTIGATKTEAGARALMLAKPVVVAVTEHRAAQRREAGKFGDAWLDTGLVFTNRDGTPLQPGRITDLFARLAREAGLPPIRLHDLRHGTATHALSAGVAIKVVSEMLGHSTTAITADLYTSVVDEAKRHAANAIAAQLERKMDGSGQPSRMRTA
ncbi:site-specific integrase [Catenulispora sp. NF23]|uniref:tyrosine-type recombinase/integrase n=1 Tax=Catenulispora pinistramenti TaxID=2705254 RepID=UPI001BA5D7FB|nr:site-specific integrase [Catenulispora pinistramenti]MBS2533124.1 site-specific integrase [Catenulispora pinistramenti]